jgi:hypothetical protein
MDREGEFRELAGARDELTCRRRRQSRAAYRASARKGDAPA